MLETRLCEAELVPQDGFVRLELRVLGHQAQDVVILGSLDVVRLGRDGDTVGGRSKLLPRSADGAVDVLLVLGHGLQVGVQVIDHSIGLQGLRVVLLEFFQLFFLVRCHLGQVIGTGHVVVLVEVLARHDLDSLDLVDHLTLRGVSGAINQAVAARGRFTGVVAVCVDIKGVFRGGAAVGGKAHRAATLRLAGGVDDLPVDLASRGRSCLRKGWRRAEGQQTRQGRQAEPN